MDHLSKVKLLGLQLVLIAETRIADNCDKVNLSADLIEKEEELLEILDSLAKEEK